ncbi:MAG TPA: type II toxin-antitoxin system VapC family toxin [Casimicrobiaceae bacterium]|nr:type II toxin-antitoxin system VapC family toxin [Casimicrobiaceae bacterium]
MAFVLDASVAIAWVVSSQATPYTRRIRLRAKRDSYHVPSIFVAEVANVLVVLERRGILTENGSDVAADVLSRLDPILHEPDLSVPQLRALARRFGLSAYDATYLALAIDLRLPIACGDRQLKTALRPAGVKLA